MKKLPKYLLIFLPIIIVLIILYFFVPTSIGPIVLFILLFVIPILIIFLSAKNYKNNFQKSNYFKSIIPSVIYFISLMIIGSTPFLILYFDIKKCSGDGCIGLLVLPFIAFFWGLAILIISAVINGIIKSSEKKA